jgi:predicted ATP-grasp superfamily ATP-dependent carboligase
MSTVCSPEPSNPNADRTAVRVAFGDCSNWEKLIRPHLDARYAASFVDLSRVRLSEFDVVVPLQLSHYAPLRRHSRLLGSKFLIPSPRVVSLCDDKLKLSEFLAAEGFADCVPRLRSAGAPYPYVWKKRRGWWGQHCHIVNGPRDESDLDLKDQDWFAQELVPGEVEFATHILRAAGKIRYVSTFVHKMAAAALVNGVRDSPLHSGFMRNCLHLDLFSEILSRLGFEGTACFDYKVLNGKPVLFEINPRFGGSLCSDITAYLDAYIGSLVPESTELGLRSVFARFARRLFIC